MKIFVDLYLNIFCIIDMLGYLCIVKYFLKFYRFNIYKIDF